MSVELIASALKLPPSPWPPDYYTLLGLPPGTGDAAEVELRVLERMEWLRRYQLAHPESITEAMNRLAQAMVCLTDPAAKRAYDATLGLVETAPSVSLAILAEPVAVPRRAEPIPPPPFPLPARPYRLAPSTSGNTGRHRRRIDGRRAHYHDLARVRRLLSSWDRAGKFLADPERRLVRRTDAIELVRELQSIRGNVDEASPLSAESGQPGALVLALARQPLFTQTFRGLLPSQRKALTDDWAAGRAVLVARRRGLRRQLARSRGPFRRFAPLLLRDYADVMLLLVGLTALVLAVRRGWHG